MKLRFPPNEELFFIEKKRRVTESIEPTAARMLQQPLLHRLGKIHSSFSQLSKISTILHVLCQNILTPVPKIVLRSIKHKLIYTTK